ncbi:MAG: SDR family NAD(P)-dependent oxidoreductase [Desulfobacterales bacterium]|nr:SDR family NAD(P)-dependent oxidoreductase [Desulfobacterales bacterium]
MQDFKNKVAVITGGASGIGLGLAEHCVDLGMKIVLADIEEAALFSATEKLKSNGHVALPILTDVSKLEDVSMLAVKTIEHFNRVDLLFNNAGVASGASIWENTAKDCEWVIGVNLLGVIHCIRKFVPIMLKQNNPCHIVNTSSVTGISTYHPSSLYHLTKHGILALSEQIYHELKMKGAKVNISVLCPGFVNTKILDAERNRPAHYKNDMSNIQKQSETDEIEQTFRKMIEEGMSPAQVAQITFEAVRKEQFYIFTHPDEIGLARLRLKNILEMNNPVLPPFE